MRLEAVVGVLALAIVTTGSAVVSPGPSVIPSSPSIRSEFGLHCEDTMAGETATIESRAGDQRFRASFDVEGRIRIEAENENGSDRHRVRVELCGFLEFEDSDGDGTFSSGDNVTAVTPFGEFEAIEPVSGAGMIGFRVTTTDGATSVTALFPAGFPAASDPVLTWSIRSAHECTSGTHFAAVNEHRDEVNGERTEGRTLLPAACGGLLEASGSF